ncbi:hypothetical protein Tco_1438832 [Tanacetum coccineum]
MSRENPQATIVSEELLVPSANRLTIKKNNQRVASDSNITDTLLKLVVGILKHHKLYKPVSLTATLPVIYLHQFWTTITHNSHTHTFNFEINTQNFTLNVGLLRTILQMPPLVANKPYTKPPIEKQILAFIKILGYDEDTKAKMTFVSTFVATKLRQPWRAILRYKYYKHKKNESEKAEVVEELEEQHVSPIRSGKGKGYMRSGNHEVNVPSAFRKNVVQQTMSKTGNLSVDKEKNDVTDVGDKISHVWILAIDKSPEGASEEEQESRGEEI